MACFLRRLLCAAAVILNGFLIIQPADAAEPLLKNGNFAEWKDDVPVGWSVEIGARNGQGPASVVKTLEGGGLSLHGDDSTTLWKSISQSVPITGKSYYRLTYEARARDLKRFGRQFDNHYVGVIVKNGHGDRIAMNVHPIETTEWMEGSLSIPGSADAKTADVLIFLSMSGTLDVRKVVLEPLRAEDSFQILVDDMDRHYSFFAAKKIDWKALVAKYQPQVDKATNTAGFVEAVREMLGELRDPHVSIQAPGGRTVATSARKYSGNYDFQYVARQLKTPVQIGKIGFVGRGNTGFGYVAFGSLGGEEATYQQLEKAGAALLDAPGLIIDLRANNGGDERRAQRFVGLLTDQPLVYAKSKIRSGPEHDQFTEERDRILEPQGSAKAYLRPIICLIGPGCISSGEGMALMIKALPHATLIGQPTAGASGNPAPIALPNGVTVNYSRWLSLTPEEELIEEKGVTPEVVVQHRKGSDPTFDAAVKLLEKRIREGTKK